MSQNNTINFVLGAAIGGIAAYYLARHQDEIVNKIYELKENLNIDNNELINKTKDKLDSLTQSIHSTIERFSGDDDSDKSQEVAAIMEELEQLRAEVQALKAVN
ncbi:YtxH domain-containing protein [Sulfurimonas sp.]|uniref:YtxH domain-containing protein n=1 Tax=Sulfurimonas sp. TaxID=2022749 RepID=UPI0025E7906B|nr:YtxH domain-containing protein [Sulfurimonas sp.]MDD5158144.1 YtxH domain-containing protein [Sulfurimonas sp.]